MFCACFIIGFWGYYIVGKFPIMRWHMNKIGSEKRKILKANKSEKNKYYEIVFSPNSP